MKYKPTKRPKRVSVTYEKVTNYISEYQCPTCRVIRVGSGPRRNVTRFKCECGQELIVDRHIDKKEETKQQQKATITEKVINVNRSVV